MNSFKSLLVLTDKLDRIDWLTILPSENSKIQENQTGYIIGQLPTAEVAVVFSHNCDVPASFQQQSRLRKVLYLRQTHWATGIQKYQQKNIYVC